MLFTNKAMLAQFGRACTPEERAAIMESAHPDDIEHFRQFMTSEYNNILVI